MNSNGILKVLHKGVTVSPPRKPLEQSNFFLITYVLQLSCIFCCMKLEMLHRRKVWTLAQAFLATPFPHLFKIRHLDWFGVQFPFFQHMMLLQWITRSDVFRRQLTVLILNNQQVWTYCLLKNCLKMLEYDYSGAVSFPRRTKSSATLLQKPQNSHN